MKLRSKWQILSRKVCLFLCLCLIFANGFVLGDTAGAYFEEKYKTYPVVLAGDVAAIHSKNMLLIRMDNDKVIEQMGSNELIYPASLTKIMTVIVAIESIENLDRMVVMQPEWIENLLRKEASMAGYAAGESACMRDLLYGAMLPSGAECAVALAYSVASSETAFADMINEKAKRLGMDHTHFVNATGLHNDRHYTTLNDIAILLDYALKNELFSKIYMTKTYTTQPTTLHPAGITFESTMFQKLESSPSGISIIGGKTGFTPQAGLCLASVAEIDGQNYMLLTAGAKGNAGGNPWHIRDALTIYGKLLSDSHDQSSKSGDDQ